MGWWGGRGAPLCRLAVTRCHDVTNPSRDDTSHRHTQHSQLMIPGENKLDKSYHIIRAVPSSLFGCQLPVHKDHYEQDN